MRDTAEHLRSESGGSVESHESQESDVDLSYYLGENPDDEPSPDDLRVAHETNMLDLTNFDGDVDMALPGDAYLSRRLKKEGKLRRLQSHRFSTTEKMNQPTRLSQALSYDEAETPRHVPKSRPVYPDQLATPSPSSRVRPQLRKITTSSAQLTDRLLPISPFSERPTSASSERDLYSPLSYRSESPLRAHSPLNSSPLSSDLIPTVSLVTADGSRSPAYPVKGHHDTPHAVQMTPSTSNAHHTSRSPANSTSTLGASGSVPFEMDEQEAIDVNVVSELARPGKPKLDKVIADEAQASKGAVVVACPSTFLKIWGVFII